MEQTALGHGVLVLLYQIILFKILETVFINEFDFPPLIHFGANVTLMNIRNWGKFLFSFYALKQFECIGVIYSLKVKQNPL